jgi:hypothetical protein
MAGFCCGGAFDGGEQGGAGLAGQAAELGREGRIEGGPAAPGGGDGLFETAAVLFAEPGEHLLVGEDEPAQGLDLLLGWRGAGPGPLGELGSGGGEAFGVGEQPAEVGAQLRLVGGVGAEVFAAQAAVPERAGPPAGGDVGGLGADPERDGDLPDLLAQSLGGQQGAAIGPDPPGVRADLERAEGVLGGPLALGGDP